MTIKLVSCGLSLLLVLLLGFSTLASGAGVMPQADSVTVSVQQLLSPRESRRLLDIGGYGLLLLPETYGFYQQRQFAPAWLGDQDLSTQGGQLLRVLQSAEQEGLRPEEYQVPTIELLTVQMRVFSSHGLSPEPELLARLDILLSDAFLRYAQDVARGRIKAATIYPKEWSAVPRTVNLVGLLQSALDHQRVVEALEDLLPEDPGYARLRDHLATYREIAAEGGWPQLPRGPVVRPGDRDWRLSWLRKHLILVGDLNPEEMREDDYFDIAATEALWRYQKRHGLKSDGVLGPETLAALNLSVEERIFQIEMNLERQRWRPADSRSRYIAVEITDFSLGVIEDGEVVLSMPVVVGTRARPTPVFSAFMRYLDFAPYWYVPPTILREDKLALIKSDPQYLSAHHYEIVPFDKGTEGPILPETIDWEGVTAANFPGMLRQKPGPWNSLGRVKFMFPNKYHVYLHDSPQRYLFDHARRSYSSGCVRVERPLELALYLLHKQESWDRERIEKAMAAEAPLRVLLEEPIPVHILYRTAWVDRGGALQFRRDIYQWDAVLYTALRHHNRKAAVLLSGLRTSLR